MQRTKNRKKTRLKQYRKSRKEVQNVVVIVNPPGSSSLRYRSAIAPLLHRYHYAVALLSLRCRTVIALISFRCRSAAVAPLSRCCCTAIAPILIHCCSAAVAPDVDTQSHRYRATVAPLLSLLLWLHSCTAIAPILLCCRAVVEPLSLRPREGINNSKLNCCCSTVTTLSLLLSIVRFTRFSPQEA